MRVRASECVCLFFDGGKLVVDDYLDHRQLAITPEGERVLRWFATWGDIGSLDERLVPIADRLVEADLLVVEGSDRHAREELVLARWRAWGPSARHYHFASRSRVGERFLSLVEDAETMRRRSQDAPPPGAFKTIADAPLVRLAQGRPATDAGLVDALYGRRSVREFAETALALDELAGILEGANGVVDVREHPELGTAVFRTSPSAGGSSPLEIYLHARAVDGLDTGVYHHAPLRGGLEWVGPGLEGDELLQAVGGQPWLASAPALLVYTAIVERSQWRYDTVRGYRDVLIGLGHLSQTVLLLAAASGLGAVFATAVCEDALESMLECENGEVVLGVAAIGKPRR